VLIESFVCNGDFAPTEGSHVRLWTEKLIMPFSYVVYSEHRLVVSTGSDRVTWEEIKERQDQTKTDPG
jgi:hypothetical protein